MTPEFRGKLLNEVETNDGFFEMLKIVARECPAKMVTELIAISL